jgi:uncharacterized protein (DUF433 family)
MTKYSLPPDRYIIQSMASLETTHAAPLTVWDDGSIRVGSSRVPLDSIVHEFTGGATAEQIQDDFPSLSLREIYGAISYYLDHQHQVDDYVRQRELEAAKVRAEIEDLPRMDALRRRIRQQSTPSKA